MVQEIVPLLCIVMIRETDTTHDIAAKRTKHMVQPHNLTRTLELPQPRLHL
jgi:hypothetical protein